MKSTTLCYIEKDNQYLMLHRNKKHNDPNEGKWIGVGGHIEEDESPEECVIREVFEETGLTLKEYSYRGVIYFISDVYEDEVMHLYTASGFEGQIKECDEGELLWVDKDKIKDLNLWEGDVHFLNRLLVSDEFFTMRLEYKKDELVSVKLDDK